MTRYFYITTPIYYVNDMPHIGHAYTTAACDFIARFKRLDGFSVKFLTGTDEHGQKIEKAAERAGVPTQDFVDRVSQSFVGLISTMDFSPDDFIRTTQMRHKSYVQMIWARLQQKGFIYKDKYSGWYAVRDEAFYNVEEIVDGLAPTGAAVEWVEEESYFFRLSSFQQELLEFYRDNPGFIWPSSRYNEVVSFVKSGLRDLSISRTSFNWGISVPGDDKHVVYVWMDALCNYLSAVGGEDSPYWPADLHVVGKDILRFHAVYWPAFLMAAGISLPKKIFAHGWWTSNGEKISKSLGNAIDPVDLVHQFGSDYVRYFMLREVPFGNDGNYVTKNLVERINSELVHNIGNLSQRVLSFVQQYCDGMVPASPIPGPLLKQAYELPEHMRQLIDRQELHLVLGAVLELSTDGNKYIDQQAPWKLRSSDVQAMYDVISTLIEVIRVIAITLQSITPKAASVLLANLGLEGQDISRIRCEYFLPPGTVLPAPVVAFPKLEVVENL